VFKTAPMLSRDAFKSRHFRIWAIGLFIVVVSVSIVFVHLGKSPSEPFVSVSIATTNAYPGNPSVLQTFSIEVSNKMSFNVNFWIEAEEGNWLYGISSLAAHSQKRVILLEPKEGVKLSVSYQRQLKPFEASAFKTFPWLERHYPFHPRRSLATYEWKGTDE